MYKYGKWKIINGGIQIMKATGIVRRIDYSVIIGAKVRSLENRGFSLIFVQFHQYPSRDEAAITTA